MAKEASEIDYVFCPHCATKNPKKAYVCLSCFKVMFTNPKKSFWGFQIPTSVSVTVIFASLVLAALYLGNRWLSNVEANMTLNIKTREYNVNLTADKRKNEDLKKEIDVEHLDSDTSLPVEKTP